MRLKVISLLLVLCLAFSVGPALAQTDTSRSMDKSMTGSADKMASGIDQKTIIVGGKVNGTVTIDKMNGMAGMAGGMGSTGKTMTRSFSGDMIVVKDISNKTETTILIGKMDGMTKRMVMIGKTQYVNETSGENAGMVGMTRIDNRIGAMDNEKVAITGNITCMSVGKIVVLGQPNDLKELSSENAGMTGTSESMDNMTGTMDNKSVIATANIRYNMTGKMIIVGKLSDIKKEMMTGSENESMQGVAAGKVGAVRVSNENMTGAAVGKAGAVGVSNENMTGIAAGKAGAVGVSNEDLTIIMTGTTVCKITGINMVVIGKMGEMAGAQTGRTGEESGMMTKPSM